MHFRSHLCWIRLGWICLAVWSAMGAVASAQEFIDRRPRGEYRIEPAGISIDEAVRMAERRYGARAVKAEAVNDGDRRIYQIRLLKDGKVWIVRVDAQTGTMQ